MKVYQQLNAAREEFHASKIEKTGLNKFAGYKYFELADFIIPALQIFKKHGLCAVVSFGADVASMTIASIEDGTSVVITSPMSSVALKGCHEVQNLGAVQTYLRRYLWVAALEIVEHDAVGSSEPRKDDKPVRSLVVKATDGIENDIAPERRQELDSLAASYIESWKAGKTLKVINHFYTLTNDEQVYMTKCLQGESKMRAEIKANSPHKQAA